MARLIKRLRCDEVQFLTLTKQRSSSYLSLSTTAIRITKSVYKPLINFELLIDLVNQKVMYDSWQYTPVLPIYMVNCWYMRLVLSLCIIDTHPNLVNAMTYFILYCSTVKSRCPQWQLWSNLYFRMPPLIVVTAAPKTSYYTCEALWWRRVCGDQACVIMMGDEISFPMNPAIKCNERYRIYFLKIEAKW